jgi:hypothetical protein
VKLLQHVLTVEQKTPVVRGKLESVTVRLGRLSGTPWKELQHERWAKLFE